jgi:hypothetical protein
VTWSTGNLNPPPCQCFPLSFFFSFFPSLGAVLVSWHNHGRQIHNGLFIREPSPQKLTTNSSSHTELNVSVSTCQSESLCLSHPPHHTSTLPPLHFEHPLFLTATLPSQLVLTLYPPTESPSHSQISLISPPPSSARRVPMLRPFPAQC